MKYLLIALLLMGCSSGKEVVSEPIPLNELERFAAQAKTVCANPTIQISQATCIKSTRCYKCSVCLMEESSVTATCPNPIGNGSPVSMEFSFQQLTDEGRLRKE